MHETAWAKINLALHVRARRADGYHDIESLFAFADAGDLLSAGMDERLSLTIAGPFADGLSDGEDNLVIRAAQALRDAAAPGRGARITLDKRLPVAAGIGGGSADAAAALRLLARLWQVEDEPLLMRIAASLGADVPACVRSRTLRGEGRGDRLDLIDDAALVGMPVLLVNPRIPLATGPVFRGWNGEDRGALASGPPLDAALSGRNDLEAPAVALVPEIGGIVSALAAMPGVRLARMSGSGATCFALFDDAEARDRAAASIADRRPGYWQLAAVLR
nr:4-(cytidine 5'-diphospho)-2-C-methyl-D-erythritol kinase [Sphingomonas colocasiae]